MKHMTPVLGAVLFLFAGCAALPPAPELRPEPAPAWAMEGGDAARLCRAEGSPGDAWRLPEIALYAPEHVPSPIGEYASALVVGDRVIVGSAAGGVYGLDAKTLAVRWFAPLKGRVYATPAWAEGRLFVGDDGGQITALTRDGETLWTVSFVYPVMSSLVAEGGRLYIVAADQNLYCIEAATGRPLWQYGRSAPERNRVFGAMTVAAAGGRVYLGSGGGELLAFDAAAGSVLWRAELARKGSFPDLVAGPAVADGVVYAGSRLGGTAAFRAEDGALLWKSAVRAASGVAVGEKLLYVGTGGGGAAALDRGDGKTVWTAPLDGKGTPGRPTLAGDLLLVGTSEGSLFGLDAATGAERARYAPGSGLNAEPWADGRGWIIHSNAGNLHRMNRSGSWD